MLENQEGKRYAEALSGNISDDSQLGVALKNLKDFGEAMKIEKQLSRFFEHPSISTEKKKNAKKPEKLPFQKRRQMPVRNLSKIEYSLFHPIH